MTAVSPLDLLFDDDPAPPLPDLARKGPGDRPVVSCYLDARAGSGHCLAFLNRKAAHIRQALKGVDRLDFDSAIELIRRKLDSTLSEGCQGIALFTPAAMTDRQLALVQTSAPLDNRLVYSRTPEILPLLALRQRAPSGNLLRVCDGGFELLPIGMGSHPKPICSEILPRVASGSAEAGRPISAPFGRESWQSLADSQRVLGDALSGCRGPLLLAGTTDALADLSDWLPAEATERLVGCMEARAGADRHALIEEARNRLASLFRAEAKRLAIETLERRHSGETVVGLRSVLQTLERDAADTVVVSDWDQFGLGLPWEDKVTVCFEALRRRCRIVLCDSVQLREAGGVGCLLRSPPAQDITPNKGAASRLQDVA